MKLTKSKELFERGQDLLPGGVSSPVRTFGEVETPPLYIREGKGGYVTDVDGNRYLDVMCGLGPALLGHAHPRLCEAVSQQMAKGAVYAAGTEMEYDLADRIKAHSPAIQKLRFVCSGTEAVMSAVRLAKAQTGRSAIVKFNGCYHGHSDIMQGHITKGKSSSDRARSGIDGEIVNNTVVCDYNDLAQVRDVFKKAPNRFAAIILEPIATNMGLVRPDRGFLEGLREICDEHHALLIFDEVVVGYRVQLGSVTNWCGVTPDLITYGKIIGGGTPVGLYGGKAEIMDQLDRAGGVFQGGTFAGNPLTMAAGLATMDILEQENFYTDLNGLGVAFEAALLKGLRKAGVPFTVDRIGSMFSLILAPGLERLKSRADVARQDSHLFSRLHMDLASKGFLLPPSIEEPGFISSVHKATELRALAEAIATSLGKLLDIDPNLVKKRSAEVEDMLVQ